MSSAQAAAIDRYADEVESTLKSLIRSQKLAKPPVPIETYSAVYPARGLEIFNEVFFPPEEPEEQKRVSRTLAVVQAESIHGLSTMTPRDAVLKNAPVCSDIWVLAIAWDYAAYILMLAFLFFPSAERAAGFKDTPRPDGQSFIARAFRAHPRPHRHDIDE